MPTSAISSSPGDARPPARPCRRAAAFVIGLLALTLAAQPARAKVFMTREEALHLVFPRDGTAQRKTAFLTEEQVAEVKKASGVELPTKVITYYEGPGATVYFDTHRVRTLAETIMVVVTPAGTIARIDILSFNEPEDYLPPARWIRQLEGHRLDNDLSVRTGIRPITGATLSGRAIVHAARRVLALHQVLDHPPVPPAKAKP